MDKWNQRLDKIKEMWEIKSDTALAKVMRMSQVSIFNIRKGTTQPSAVTKLKIMDRLGFSYAREALTEILPEDEQKKFLSGWNKLTKKLNKIDEGE